MVWILFGCSVSLSEDSFTFKIGDEETSSPSGYKCVVTEEEWAVDTAHDPTYELRGYSWACQSSPILNKFYLDVGSNSDDFKDFNGLSNEAVWTAFNKGIGFINRSGANVQIRLAPEAENLSGDYGSDRDVNSMYPKYGTSGGAQTALMATSCRIQSDSALGPRSCIVIVYQQYRDENGVVVNIPWLGGSGVPTDKEISMWSSALHEFGHVLGLGHYEGDGSMMHATQDFGEILSISDMDKEAILWMYGVI